MKVVDEVRYDLIMAYTGWKGKHLKLRAGRRVYFVVPNDDGTFTRVRCYVRKARRPAWNDWTRPRQVELDMAGINTAITAWEWQVEMVKAGEPSWY